MPSHMEIGYIIIFALVAVAALMKAMDGAK